MLPTARCLTANARCWIWQTQINRNFQFNEKIKNKKNKKKNKKQKEKNQTNWVKKCEKAKKLLQALFLH